MGEALDPSVEDGSLHLRVARFQPESCGQIRLMIFPLYLSIASALSERQACVVHVKARRENKR